MARKKIAKLKCYTVGDLIASLQKLDSKMEVMGFDGAGMYVRLRTPLDVGKHLGLWKVWDTEAWGDGRHRATISNADSFIQKPFTPVALATKVRQLLDHQDRRAASGSTDAEG